MGWTANGLWPIALCGAIAFGCGRHEKAEATGKPALPDAASSAHSDEAEHEELPKRVRVTDEVIAAAKIAFVKVARERLDAVLELPGEIAADPDGSARVSAPVAGRIASVAFAEGDSVTKGQVLATVRVADLGERQAAYASASAKLEASRAKVKRYEDLVAAGAASRQELETARADEATHEAETRAAAARLGALGLGASGKPGSTIELRAPIAGTIVRRDAVVGQPLDSEHVIAAIVDLSAVWFLGRVFENDLGRVQLRAPAEITLNAYPKEAFVGSVEFIGREIDPIARTVMARVRLSNRGDLLRLGLFGTARITIGEPQPGPPPLVVPRSAITELNGKPMVFVRHPDNDFEIHPIVVGRAALGRVEVLSGLREGEDVVSEGVFTLKSLVLKGSMAGEE